MRASKSATVTDGVFQYLQEGISSGRWKPGDKLPSEAELCRELSASRVTVRSAIGRLTGLGLAQSLQGKGTFVSPPPTELPLNTLLYLPTADLLNVFEFRKIIESESAALAAIRATSADVQAMEESIVHMESGLSDPDVAEQDLTFHQLVAQASGNEIILQVFQAMRSIYSRMFEENVSRLGKAGSEHHRRILLAVQTRDMQTARQCMLDHLDDTMRALCRS